MATFKTFEEMAVWRKSRELTKQIYELSASGTFARDYGLKDQIRRACVSIMSNIAEGFARSGTGEFVQFLATAKGSSGEGGLALRSFRRNYLQKNEFESLCGSVTEISQMISGLMRYLRGSGVRGTKFKMPPELET